MKLNLMLCYVDNNISYIDAEAMHIKEPILACMQGLEYSESLRLSLSVSK